MKIHEKAVTEGFLLVFCDLTPLWLCFVRVEVMYSVAVFFFLNTLLEIWYFIIACLMAS